MAATVEAWAKEATLKRAPLASVRRAAVYRVHPRFSHLRRWGGGRSSAWGPGSPAGQGRTDGHHPIYELVCMSKIDADKAVTLA